MVPIMTREKIKFIGKMISKRGSGVFAKMLFLILVSMIRNSRALYKHLRARGVLVLLWVANEEDEFWEAWDMFGDSIDGIMTDRPSKLREWVQRVV